MAFASWIVSYTIIALMSASLCQDDRQRRNLLACVIIYGAFAFFYVNPLYGLPVVLGGYAAVRTGAYLRKHHPTAFEGKSLTGRNRRFQAVSMALLVLLIQPALFGIVDKFPEHYTVSGFKVVKPQYYTLNVTGDGLFQASFTNGVGVSILPDEPNIKVSDDTKNINCTVQIKLDPPGQKVRPGENFILVASGCGAGDRGEKLNISVILPYTLEVGGIKITQTESGRISGYHR